MDYKVIDRVGDCRFVHGLQHSEKTTISEGIHLPTGVKVRMKTVRGQNMADYERGRELSREATVLARLSHPNIIHVYHLVKHADLRILVTEWIDGLSLESFIRLFFHHCLPEGIARLYCRQLVSAIIAMQRKSILLREIPIKSLVITRDFRCIKFTDLSSALCLPLRKDVTSATCSPEFTAPELIQENVKTVGPEAVSWPLGVVLFYMLVGELPFQSPYYDHKRRERLLRFALRGLSPNHVAAISSFTPVLYFTCSKLLACQLLLRQLLEPRAIVRIPICELCTNAWITDSGSQPFQPFSPCSAHIIASLETVSKLTPSTSYKGSTVNNNHQPLGKWEAPADRGLLNRVKGMFTKNANDESSTETRGNEWLLATDVEANDATMPSDSADTNVPFGEQKCNNITEAVDYLARLRKTSASEVARAVMERPIGEVSATFQILLNLQRQNAGIYLVDHTTPGWPQLESAWFMAFMDSTMMKRLRVSAGDVGSFEDSVLKGGLRSINWWWCPILLRNLGNCICNESGEVFIGSQLDKKAFRRDLMVSIEAFERKMMGQTTSQSKTEITPSLISCKTLDSRRPKEIKSKHSINAFGVVVMRKTNQLQTPKDSSRLVREFTERLRRSSMRASVRILTNQIRLYKGKPSLPNLSGNLPTTASWGGKKKVNPNPACSDATANDVWPLLTDTPLLRKNESSQWPTPAELTGRSRNDTINDFSIPNSWNAPGTSMALRTLGETDDRNDSWPPLDTAQTSNSIDPVSMPRAITGSGNLVASESAFTSRQRIQGVASGKPRNESFASWAPSVDGDFSAFASQQLPPTSDKNVTNCQQSGDAVCSSVSDSGNHIDGQNETAVIINTLINSKECWGQQPVDQTTPWDMALLNEELVSASTAASTPGNHNSTGLLGDAVSLAMKQRRSVRNSSGIANVGVSVESNVWSSEPPTGTGIWEMHYESIGDRSGRWKQPSSSAGTVGVVGGGGGSPRLDIVASPPGNHRILSSFLSPSPIQQQQQGRGAFQNNFFPPQTQQRFGQAAQQPPPGSGRGVFGPNGILNAGTTAGGGFKSQASGIAQGSTGWSLSLTPDGQSPLDDTKRFLAPSGPWGSEGRGLGKQQQQLSLSDTTRWSSSLAPPSSVSVDNIPPSSAPAAPLSWQSGMDPRKFVPWSQQTALTPQLPSAAVPQRFHLRQNTSVLPTAASSGASASVSSTSTQPLRLLPPNVNHQHHTHPHQAPSATTALLRTDIARQLMLLGFHDDAGALLSDNGIDDLEKFLYDLRERTGGMHPGLNQLINSVSTVLAASSGGPADLQQQQQLGPMPQAFDLFDNRCSGVTSHLGKQHFAGRQNSASASETLGQLVMRATHLQATIVQLDKKKRELNMKHSQLRKMNMGGPTAHHSNSMLQEIVLQQAQISQQIEAQEAQLGQVRLQIAFLTRLTTGGGGGGGIGNEDSTAAAAAATAAMLMRLRSGGGNGSVGPPPTRMVNHPMGGFGSCGPRGNGMLINSPLPSTDLAPRLADLKLSMDVGRRMPWEGGGGGGVWDVPSPHQFSHVSSPNTFLNSDPTSNVFPLTSSTLGDRRWTTSNSSSDFHQPPAPSLSNTTAVAAAANAIWNASWLLLSDLTPQFSLEVLRISITTALDQQQQQQNVVIGDGSGGPSNVGTVSSTPSYEVHPNLTSRYVLVGFLNPADASAVSTFISSTANSTIKLANSVTIISPAEAMAKLQEIKTLDDELQQQQQQQNPSQQQTPQQQGTQLTWPPTNVPASE
ncbi:unnamed protein product [Hydatigera taeniaeformis]|uniref:Protein kinase domain-containing protein n=1 Tax=Hydatigena taeniaeformis TaxID=6205 RepID=A0A158REV4_HYDTA|nr:unnamed protein product [Hydatigera taeniaeformis]